MKKGEYVEPHKLVSLVMDSKLLRAVAFATITSKVKGIPMPTPSLKKHLDSKWEWTTRYTFFETMLGFLALSLVNKQSIDGLGMAKLADL